MDLFSQRNTPLPDVYTYDEIPDRLCGQLSHIVEDLCEMVRSDKVDEVHGRLLREWGLRVMVSSPRYSMADFVDFLLSNRARTFQILDLVELLLREWLSYFSDERELLSRVKDIVAEVNTKFRRAGVGFEFVDDRFIRIDSQLAHQEIVKPALGILSDPAYSVPDSEYRKAHEHFRHGRYAECLVDCCKAFESVMKIICTSKGWAFQPTDAASRVLKVLTDNGLFAGYMGNQLNHMVGLLEGTVPTVRNKLSGHGAGATPVVVPEEYAAFALHSTAADILLLAKLAK